MEKIDLSSDTIFIGNALRRVRLFTFVGAHSGLKVSNLSKSDADKFLLDKVKKFKYLCKIHLYLEGCVLVVNHVLLSILLYFILR